MGYKCIFIALRLWFIPSKAQINQALYMKKKSIKCVLASLTRNKSENHSIILQITCHLHFVIHVKYNATLANYFKTQSCGKFFLVSHL